MPFTAGVVIFVESSLTQQDQQATLPGEFDSGGSNHVILYVFNVYDVYDVHSVYDIHSEASPNLDGELPIEDGG